MLVHWYCDLLLEGINSTDTTGEENHIFAAYGLTPPHSPPPGAETFNGSKTNLNLNLKISSFAEPETERLSKCSFIPVVTERITYKS